jgi:hypothetical protein
MGNLVFQATLGGQVNLVGPNTASTFNLNVPAVSSTLATLTGTETFTNKTLTAPTLASANITTALTLTGASGTSGQALTSAGSGNAPTWTTISATPGGSTTQVQYNNAGAFAGISGVTTDGTRMTASTTIGVGAATPSTSGSGITFPATQSASSDANTLDDYEEGTFTPILADSASVSNAATMTVQEGFYTKIGNTVTIQIQIVWTSKGSMGAGNNTRIYGVPFSAKSNTSGYYWPALLTMSSALTGFMAAQEGGGTAIVTISTNAPGSELSTSYVSTSGRLLIQYTYRTT